ncbi:hypothetical protein HK100_000386 [Physocladia obscura]|uniref:Myb-like domain-containing protein n=1 Tax=Physocladia obscura TaxID=109957 RepID=A0AAD5SYI6_9FUNG|nr:hypothetical protein HK100_000386 [Physocladia obscura]
MPHFTGSGIGIGNKRAHGTESSAQESLLAMMDAVSGGDGSGGGTGAGAVGDPAGPAERTRAISNNIHVRLQLPDGDPPASAANTPSAATSAALTSSANFSRELQASFISQSYQNQQLQQQHQQQQQQQQEQHPLLGKHLLAAVSFASSLKSNTNHRRSASFGSASQQQFEVQQQQQQYQLDQQQQHQQQQQQQQQTQTSFSQMNAMYLQPIPIQPSNFSAASSPFFNSQTGNIGGIQKLLDSPHDAPHQDASLYGGHHLERPHSQSQVPLVGTLFHRESGSSLSTNNPQNVLLREYNTGIAEYPQHQQQQQHEPYQLPSQPEYVPIQSFISHQHHQFSQSHDPNNTVSSPHHQAFNPHSQQHHSLENTQHHSDQLHQYHAYPQHHYQFQQQPGQNQHPQIPHGPHDAQLPHGYSQNQQQYISPTQQSTGILSTISAIPGIANRPTTLIPSGVVPAETPKPVTAVVAKKRGKKQQNSGAKLSSKTQKSDVTNGEKSTATGTRPRNKWTPPELAALEAGMLRYGTNWAGLLADPDFSHALSSRTQMQCKDKAAVEKEKRMKEARRAGRMLSVEELGVWRYACDRKRNNVGMVEVTGVAGGGGSGRGVTVQQLQVPEQRPQEQQQLQLLQQHALSAENLA